MPVHQDDDLCVPMKLKQQPLPYLAPFCILTGTVHTHQLTQTQVLPWVTRV